MDPIADDVKIDATLGSHLRVEPSILYFGTPVVLLTTLNPGWLFAGSRTLFLIYRLKEPADIFRHFTGVDGSAYVIGGVGMTLLTGGDVIMAPIRTGLGLRVGANIGYVRFTRAPSWNPF